MKTGAERSRTPSRSSAAGRKPRPTVALKKRGKFSAHLELARTTITADKTIRAFCRLVDDLPESERKIRDSAIVRSFSVGIQTEIGSPAQDFQVRQETVTSVSEVGAEIVLTVYAPVRKPSRK
jgi:hypothetical protein